MCVHEKYINPFPNYGFKKIFGDEEDTELFYRDLINSIDTARAEGKVEVAEASLAENIDIKTIVLITGFSEEEIEALNV